MSLDGVQRSRGMTGEWHIVPYMCSN